MAIQVLRVQSITVKDFAGARGQHASGIKRPDVVREVPPGERAIVELDGVDGPAAARRAVHSAAADRRRTGRRGRPGNPYWEALFAGPPAYDAPDAWPADRELAWARALVPWLRSVAPEATVASATLHRDETSPHVHVVFACAAVSWNATQGELVRSMGRNSRIRGSGYIALQDSLHAGVSAGFELERGVSAAESGRRHEPIDRSKAAGAERIRAEARAECLRDLAVWSVKRSVRGAQGSTVEEEHAIFLACADSGRELREASSALDAAGAGARGADPGEDPRPAAGAEPGPEPGPEPAVDSTAGPKAASRTPAASDAERRAASEARAERVSRQMAAAGPAPMMHLGHER